jgi:glycosidase
LGERGLKLILDYVPNHVATDHYWVTQRPDLLVCGTEESLGANPDLFFAASNGNGENLVIAHGRDPYFPGWIDTAQVNAFSPDLRQETIQTLLDIAAQCDGVRCDMAMLVANDVFSRTWGDHLADTAPQAEFWEYVIPAVKERYPSFKFIAEVYWGMEYTLLKQGFDMTYDKRLYDQIQDGHVAEIRQHLEAKPSYQARQVRFIENHDESRAAVSLGIERSRAAATLICTLPGVVLLHDGQLTGRRVKLPMQISRQPEEPSNGALADFYHRLLSETHTSIYQNGRWRLFEIHESYSGDTTHDNLLAYGWSYEGQYRVVIVNLTGTWSQGVVKLAAWSKMRRQCWRLYDVLGRVYTYRDGDKVLDTGLSVELEAFQSQILRFEPMTSARDGQHSLMFGKK